MYNPGVENRAGEILARGITGGIEALTRGWQDGQRKKEEQKRFSSLAKATEGMIKAALPKEKADEVLKIDPNETPMNRYARLMAMGENFVLENKLKQYQEQQASQQRANLNAANLLAYSNQMPGYGPQTFADDQAMQGQAASPLAQYAAQTYQMTGNADMAGLADIAKAQAVEQTRMGRPGKQIDPVSIRAYGPKGEPIDVSVDRYTGQEIGRGPVSQPKYVRSPEEEAEAEQLKLRTQGAYKANEDLIAAGSEARKFKRNVQQARQLLGGVNTGFAANTILKMKQLGKQLGIEVGDLANAEQARVLFGNEIMARVNQTKGAVSDREMAMFSDYSANFGNTPAGNDQILRFAEAAYERSEAISRMIRELRRKGMSEYDIQLEVEAHQDENPLPVLHSELNGGSETHQSPNVPAGVDEAVWNAMTPQEKALWQKN